ncbi:MAG: hypothetical protein MUF42_08245 [Cytophagaceae bacterium]|jgi:hypothetical protein|nr:hypothetical protein [Cytophagaceae bacterium]
MSEQDDLSLKNRKWSYYFLLYFREQLKRTFQEDEGLASEISFALIITSPRLLAHPEEFEQLKEQYRAWNSEAVPVYLFTEPCTPALENVYVVPIYSIDPESNLLLTNEEIFNQGKMHYFLSRISDVLYSLSGIVFEKMGYTSEAVYLAACDDSLNPLKQLIRKDLLQNGYFVFPDLLAPLDLETRMQQAVLSVHLFAKHLEPVDASLGESRSKYENALAVKVLREKEEKSKKLLGIKPLRRIVWIPEEGSVRNEKQEAFISELRKNKDLNEGADFYWGSTELLKEAIAEMLRRQTTTRATGQQTVVQQIVVARSEKAIFKYADLQSGTETRYQENPGDPESNAESHAQLQARHHDMMHWLRPADEFRHTPVSENGITSKEEQKEEIQENQEIPLEEKNKSPEASLNEVPVQEELPSESISPAYTDANDKLEVQTERTHHKEENFINNQPTESIEKTALPKLEDELSVNTSQHPVLKQEEEEEDEDSTFEINIESNTDE